MRICLKRASECAENLEITGLRDENKFEEIAQTAMLKNK
jgi:hypothetical protein